MCKSTFNLVLDSNSIHFGSDKDILDIIYYLMKIQYIGIKNTSTSPDLSYINEEGLIIEDEIYMMHDNNDKQLYINQIFLNLINKKTDKYLINQFNQFSKFDLINILKKSNILIENKTSCLGDGISWMNEEKKYKFSDELCDFLGLSYDYQGSPKEVIQLMKTHFFEVELNKYNYSNELKNLVDYENKKFSEQKLFNSNPFYIIRNVCRKHLLVI